MSKMETFDKNLLTCIQKPESMPYSQIFEIMRKAQDANPSVEYTTRNITEQEVMDEMRGGGCTFVAFYDGQPVGTVSIFIAESKRPKWYVTGKRAAGRHLAVLPEYSGNGIASKLTLMAIEWARENGVQVILWDAAYNNFGSIATAKKVKFRKVEYIKYKNINHPTVRLAYWLTDDQPSSVKCYYHFVLSKAIIYLRAIKKGILKRFTGVRNRGKET